MADAGHRSPARLKRYVAKRNFQKTTEPSHKAGAARGKTLLFVVQKHAARRLHWDFRLEWDGTLRSWAVPKGPSLDPADKRLAVEVEDHPIAYANFEGDIPKGQYGGGHVDIWDNGRWEPVGDFNKGLKKGHLEFELFGKKLSGRWHLVRTRMQGKQTHWLLMKSGDFAARGATGKTLPTTLKPQLATLVDEVPGDGGWVYELKYDGIRLLCRVDGDDVRCISRNGLDWTAKVGPIVDALAALGLKGAWLDGELIVVDPNGRSDFSLLQHMREQGRLDELQLCIFDALYLNGKDIRGEPLSVRKKALDKALARLPRNGPLRLADQIHSDSTELLSRVCGHHLEGLIAKRVDSIYRGDRSKDWLKIKCRREQEFVVGGAAYISSRGTGAWSSLLVGVRSGDRVKYCGRVGGGFDAAERREWKQRIENLEQAKPPFDRLPERRAGEKWIWMKPKLVIQVAFADWTQDGILRQPRYLGLREDRDPATVVREVPEHTESVAKAGKPAAKRKTGDAQVLGHRLSHPDRVLFPHDGVTKLQLAEYFEAVGEYALPHLKNRPLSILRNTHGATPFFQKHFLKESGGGLKVVDIPNADKESAYVVCDSIEGLIHLAQDGAVELHSWGAVMPKPAHADRLTFDLDPGAELPWARVHEAALAIRKLMKDLGLDSWVKTTGGKGVHVVVPLAGKLPTWEVAKTFTRDVSLFMEHIAPTMFTSKTGEHNRRRKIFVDYLRNGFGATAVAAFSPRWRPRVPVSVPVEWDELEREIRGAHFNLQNVPPRMAKQRKDPWKGYWISDQALTSKTIARLAELTEA